MARPKRIDPLNVEHAVLVGFAKWLKDGKRPQVASIVQEITLSTDTTPWELIISFWRTPNEEELAEFDRAVDEWLNSQAVVVFDRRISHGIRQYLLSSILVKAGNSYGLTVF